MISKRNQEIVAAAFGSWLVEGDPVEKVRAGYDRMPPPVPADVAERAAQFGGVDGLWFEPDTTGANPPVILYFHGGGFTIGSPRSHSEMTARIARAAGAHLFSAGYRLAPENPFPAALDDAAAAYEGLLSAGTDPACIVVAGDSAGGGIAMALLVKLRDSGRPLPACAAALSAWADLSCSGDTYRTLADIDPLITPQMGLENAAGYLAGDDAQDPLASPVFADLTGLPPLLLQTGSDEMLLDDTRRLAEHARAVGVPVEVQVGEGMMHVYQLLTWLIPEAGPAIEKVGEFIRQDVR